MNKTFTKESYQRHVENYASNNSDPERQRILESWFETSNADYWRHSRMYEAAECLKHRNEATWLTVGDGRFGLDSIRLRHRGVKCIIPSDISECLLREAKERRLINDYSIENAEKLSFDDESFDYVFCKESYHHFPRPAIALYEMLRVAREGVILVEPNDSFLSPVSRLKFILRKLLGKQKHFDVNSYEKVGNYVFSVSERELEKVALGINLPCVAFKGMNDHYIAGCEFEPARFFSSKLFRKIRLHIAFKDLLCAIGLRKPNFLMACLFKNKPDAEAIQLFSSNGWTFKILPRNPHIVPEKENTLQARKEG